jgi:hypothetical protein
MCRLAKLCLKEQADRTNQMPFWRLAVFALFAMPTSGVGARKTHTSIHTYTRTYKQICGKVPKEGEKRRKIYVALQQLVAYIWIGAPYRERHGVARGGSIVAMHIHDPRRPRTPNFVRSMTHNSAGEGHFLDCPGDCEGIPNKSTPRIWIIHSLNCLIEPRKALVLSFRSVVNIHAVRPTHVICGKSVRCVGVFLLFSANYKSCILPVGERSFSGCSLKLFVSSPTF